MSRTPEPARREGGRRVGGALHLATYLASIIVIAIVVNDLAQRPGLRLRLDATKTRAYSLSEQTRQLLEELEGQWTIALVMVQQQSDPATRQQVDEVLSRYARASEHIEVLHVDPTDPATLTTYEGLLARLRTLYADGVAAYDHALDAALRAQESLEAFVQQEGGRLAAVDTWLAGDEDRQAELRRWGGVLTLMERACPQVRQEVARALAVDQGRPLADDETARSIHVAALTKWAGELDDMARVLQAWAGEIDLHEAVRRFAQESAPAYEGIAQALADAADPLRRLPPLELSRLGRELEEGEAAIIIGPRRAAVIPSAQLFPKINVRGSGQEVITFDRRFRGEQVISATIRSLLVERMPQVVFVHAEDTSLLRRAEQQADLVGVASLLTASRFGVHEWIVGQGEQPVFDADEPVVWVLVPPSRRRSLQLSPAEQGLVRAAADLISAGQNVMLNLNPSLLSKYRQRDPWAQLAASLGLTADTGHVIFQRVRLSENESQTQLGQIVVDYDQEHPICAAVNGQQTMFPYASPIALAADGPSAATPIVTVQPGAGRWLEADFEVPESLRQAAGADAVFHEPLTIGWAVSRDRTGATGSQRCLVIGSGGWMLSYAADAMVPIGGGRAALMNPGNHELMLASIAWLAGMDELIAPSPISQQIARLDGITPLVQLTWLGIAAVGAPGVIMLLAVLVWVRRRT